MHRMETKRLMGIIDMLRYALDELAAEGLIPTDEEESIETIISDAIDAIERWKPTEVEEDDIKLAYSLLENALQEIPEDLPGDARSSIETAIEELKAEEKAAGVGEGNFEAQL